MVGGRYRLEAMIGRGGMANVYRAYDALADRTVALKQLRARDQSDSQQRSRELFEREFHTLAELAHPRVVAAFDYGLDAELPYYTMELLDGGDLLELAPLPWRRACAVARDICSALSLRSDLFCRTGLPHPSLRPCFSRARRSRLRKTASAAAVSPVRSLRRRSSIASALCRENSRRLSF